MIKTFTQTDLIRYLYHETTEEEKREIDNALICDSELMSLFQDLRAMIDDLDDSTLQPSPNVVMNILAHSRSTQRKHAD